MQVQIQIQCKHVYSTEYSIYLVASATAYQVTYQQDLEGTA